MAHKWFTESGDYRPREYPDRSFLSDEKLQALLNDQMKAIEFRVKVSFCAMFVLFLLAIVLGLAGFLKVVLIAMAIFAMLCVYSIFHLIPRRRYECGNCDARMSITWKSQPDGRGARFAICEKCNRYVDTLWSGRR